MPFCDNCGTEVGTSQFCPNCGKQQVTANPYKTQNQPYNQNQGMYNQPPPQQSPPNIIITQQASQAPPMGGGPMNYGNPPPNMIGRKDGAIAAILSFLIPGLGQMYVGNVSRGVGVFFVTLCTLFFLVGFFIWIWNIFDANQQANLYNSHLYSYGRPPW